MIQLVGVFGGEVVSVGTDRLTVMLAGRPEKIDDFEGLLEPYASSSSSGRGGWPCLSWNATAERHQTEQDETEQDETRDRKSTRHGHAVLRVRRRPRPDRGPQGRHLGLRLPGARARPEPMESGVDVRVGAARGQLEPAQGRGGGSACPVAGRRGGRGRRDHDPAARHRAEGGLRRIRGAEPQRRRHVDVRPRLQHPLRPGRAARRRRRDHGRAEGPGPPRPPDLHRGRRRALADRGAPGRHRQGA